MGLLQRVLRRTTSAHAAANLPRPAAPLAAVVLSGRQTLEVVGESQYQDHLWKVVGGRAPEPIRHSVVAVLDPEPDNPYDENAIRVSIDGGVVGYLCREDAVVYGPGLRVLGERYAGRIALEGQIVGGGPRPDGLGMLGVFLDHEPGDFGVRPQQFTHVGQLRTGLAEAIATDLEDDTYDLSWLDRLSGDNSAGDIVVLRELLVNERDPIDRHFMLSELTKCLYKARDAFASALDEFDDACRQHDAEMDTIRPVLVEKFGCVPVIDLYRQAAIRCQKARDWPGARRWAERGLVVYGSEPARPESVADLEKRLAHAEAKLGEPPSRGGSPRVVGRGSVTATAAAFVEVLTCGDCGCSFERPRTRGRKPTRCPSCRGV
jgi:hypothetical protein